MRAYQVDLRDRIVAARLGGERTAIVAERFGVSVRTVERYVQQYRTRGDLSPTRPPGRQRTLSAVQETQLLTQLRLHPSATLAELCAWLARVYGVSVSVATMSRCLRRLGWTRKKGHWQPVSRTQPSGLPGGAPC